ncbi:hypothetical protein [Nakamurella sp.]|uniref:hypothetical protein n=1 Tax=Nakamurella sp. TaxID=1869182 RepID=UPI003784DFA7
MVVTPDFATHYHRADRAPFLNLSDLAPTQLTQVLAGLNSPDNAARSARRFGVRYIDLRRATEALARQLFVDRGGRPERTSPHYFVLGESDWFAGLYADAAHVRVPLAALPPDCTSWTWGDSISSLGLGTAFGLPAPDPAHCNVFRIDELPAQVAIHGLPDRTDRTGYAGHEHTLINDYVEIQLWSDLPIRRYLDSSGARR